MVYVSMKPYLTCHMLASVDGKIIADRWKADSADIFESSAATIKSDGWIFGRRTMSEFSAKKARRKRSGRFAVPKTNHVAPHGQKTYAIAIDPSGKLSWDRNHVDTKHVIAVLTTRVGGEYLDYLQSRKVSYIFAGERSLDLALALEKLNRLFGIKRLTVQGGGLNNGSFLNAGLIDEVSVIIAPFADGEIGTSSVFDIAKGMKRKPSVALQLKSMKRYRQDYVWLKFKVLQSAP